MTLEEYLNLIPSENRDKPNFIASLSAWLEVYIHMQELQVSLAGPAFDVDTAVGDQLDIIGEWVNASRLVSIPIEGVFFEWDGTAEVGWDYGTWQPPGSPSDITELPDDAYRNLIKFKIAANQWDGTTDGAYRIWEILFPDLVFLIQDNQDMSYDLAILGGIVDSLTLALIRQGAIALKPEGVRIANYYIPFDDGPVFGWDVETDYIEGWDSGSWAYEYPTL